MRLDARVAAAPTPGAAWALAFGNERDGAVVGAADLEAALAPLPPASLRIDDELDEALHHLGLSSVGQLMALPREVLPARFGTALSLRLGQGSLGRAAAAAAALAPARPPAGGIKARRRAHARRAHRERRLRRDAADGPAARAAAGRADPPPGPRGLRRPARARPPDRAPARAPGRGGGGAGGAGGGVRAGEGVEDRRGGERGRGRREEGETSGRRHVVAHIPLSLSPALPLFFHPSPPPPPGSAGAARHGLPLR